MNLHELISRDAPFIGPCCTHYPIEYRISYEKTPVLTIHWENINPLDIRLLQESEGNIHGFLIDTLNEPVQTLSLLNCFQQIIGDDEKFACCSNEYAKRIFCFGRGVHLTVTSLLPMDIRLLNDGNELGSGSIKIRFKSLDDFKDFKNLLAGILYRPITQKNGWVG